MHDSSLKIHVGIDMDVSKNSGTPKSSILIRFSLINHRFWVPLFLETPIYQSLIPQWFLGFDSDAMFTNKDLHSFVCQSQVMMAPSLVRAAQRKPSSLMNLLTLGILTKLFFGADIPPFVGFLKR